MNAKTSGENGTTQRPPSVCFVYHPQGPLRVCSGVSAVSGTWTDERRDLPDAGRASRESPPSLTAITSALLPGAGPNPSSEA